jgi:hypothetical protein
MPMQLPKYVGRLASELCPASAGGAERLVQLAAARARKNHAHSTLRLARSLRVRGKAGNNTSLIVSQTDSLGSGKRPAHLFSLRIVAELTTPTYRTAKRKPLNLLRYYTCTRRLKRGKVRAFSACAHTVFIS